MIRRITRLSSHLMGLTAGLVMGAFLSVAGAQAADAFVFGFEDLPLMDGLTQLTQDSVLFDTPQGRIVQASAIGNTTVETVVAFYDSTLPQLGWAPVGSATYQREGEVLRLEFSTMDQQLVVAFLAEPVSSR